MRSSNGTAAGARNGLASEASNGNASASAKSDERGVCVGSRGSIRGYRASRRLRKKACAGHCAMQRIGAAFRASLGSSGVTAVLPTDIGEVRRETSVECEKGN